VNDFESEWPDDYNQAGGRDRPSTPVDPPNAYGIREGAKLWWKRQDDDGAEWQLDRAVRELPASELRFLKRYPGNYGGFCYYFRHELDGQVNVLKTYSVYEVGQ